MGMHWTREQFLQGAALGVGLFAGNLIPMDWLTAHANIRTTALVLVALWTFVMVIGAVFTKPPRPKGPPEFIPAKAALTYIVEESEWGVMSRFNFIMEGSSYQDIHENITLYSIEEFSRRAALYQIDTNGLFGGSRILIPYEYWTDALLEWNSIIRGGAIKTAPTAFAAFKNIVIFEDVRVSKRDLMKAWPTPDPLWWGM